MCITLLPKLQILKQYWVNWERNMAAILPFHFGRRLFSKSRVCGTLSNVKGQEWKATLIDSEVSRIQFTYALVCVNNAIDTVI